MLAVALGFQRHRTRIAAIPSPQFSQCSLHSYVAYFDWTLTGCRTLVQKTERLRTNCHRLHMLWIDVAFRAVQGLIIMQTMLPCTRLQGSFHSLRTLEMTAETWSHIDFESTAMFVRKNASDVVSSKPIKKSP